MGFYSLIAECFACRRTFASNPRLVPSYHGEPICQDCIGIVNRRRVANGLEPWPIPAGAYEPAAEGEL